MRSFITNAAPIACANSDAELADAAKALQLRGVHEARDDRLFVGFERHEAVDGVAEDHGDTSPTLPSSA
jgi:hypothetical protein